MRIYFYLTDLLLLIILIKSNFLLASVMKESSKNSLHSSNRGSELLQSVPETLYSDSQSRVSTLTKGQMNSNMRIGTVGSFGLLQSQVSATKYGSLHVPRLLVPPLVDISRYRSTTISASDTCGAPGNVEMLCSGDMGKSCVICDQGFVSTSYSIQNIIDQEKQGDKQQTCWRSSSLLMRQRRETSKYNKTGIHSYRRANMGNHSKSELTNSSSPLFPEIIDPSKVVVIYINLGGKFEISYVSVNFCEYPPNKFVFYKSSDNGKSWQILKDFLNERNESTETMREYSCGQTNRNLSTKYDNIVGQTKHYIPDFSLSPPTDNYTTARRINPNEYYLAKLKSRRRSNRHFKNRRVGFTMYGSWIDMPDIRRKESFQSWSVVTDIKLELLEPVQSFQTESALLSEDCQTTRNDGSAFYSISDMVIGGRCVCHGHAKSCRYVEKLKSMVCDCEHNTSGNHCEKCQNNFMDVPWAPGDKYGSHACRACDCNGHSDECEFDIKTYEKNNLTTGGVCLRCKHKTTGSKCEKCRDAYKRNFEVTINDEETCIPCDCHLLGSSSQICDQTSGQCTCKPGAAGVKCDKCQSGYRQSNNISIPCILTDKQIRNDPNINLETNVQWNSQTDLHNFNGYQLEQTHQSQNRFILPFEDTSPSSCELCPLRHTTLTFKSYCKLETVLLMFVLEKHKRTGYMDYKIDILIVFRQRRPFYYHQSSEMMFKKQDAWPTWLEQDGLDGSSLKTPTRCSETRQERVKKRGCVKLRVNRTYILMSNFYRPRARRMYQSTQGSMKKGRASKDQLASQESAIRLDKYKASLVVPWTRQVFNKMKRVRMMEMMGYCRLGRKRIVHYEPKLTKPLIF